jgi:hypothetical protein
MYTDKKLYFDGPTSQAVTTDRVGSAAIDLENIGDVAQGQPLYLNVNVETGFSSSTETLAIDLVSSSGSDPAAADSFMRVLLPKAVSNYTSAGKLVRMALPSNIPYERINISYVCSDTVAGGKMLAWLSIGQDDPDSFL